MNNRIAEMAEEIQLQKTLAELLETTYDIEVTKLVKASETFLKIAHNPNHSTKEERLAINQINEASENVIATKGQLVERMNKLNQVVEDFQGFLRLN